MKILLIDDSPEAIAIARARLVRDNYEVIHATDGKAGLATASKEKPDLILLDVDLPDTSGFEICRLLKSDPELSMIPVIFLTGSTDTTDKVKGLDLGAVDYVLKPFDSYELSARVRAALRTKHLQDLLIKHAQIDPLTELWNRRALMDRLAQEWSRITRHGGVLACIMCDIDHFKQVNDTYGHRIGDEILRKVGEVLINTSRQSDFPARYGGDEFVVLVPDEDADGAYHLAERYREEISRIEVKAGKEIVSVTASFGVDDSNGLPSVEALIEAVDAALYKAKHSNRNCVVVAEKQVLPTQSD